MLYVYKVLPISTRKTEFFLINYIPNMMPCNITIKCWRFQYLHSVSI